MGKKILIIDDDPDVILFFSTILKDHGYDAIAAHDGEEGWRFLQSDSPDLVILDLMMPQKSGISLLTDMKKDRELSKIPVVMVTGVSGETGIDLESFLMRSAGRGADAEPVRPEGYIEKPVDPENLIKTIEELIGPS